MPLALANLDEQTRRLMLDEIEQDLASGTLFISNRLSSVGQAHYPEILKEAVSKYDDAWLANQLRQHGRLNTTETRRTPSGGMTTAKVPVNAHEMLAEGEFNRFYARGLCRRAIEAGIPDLEIYRAKAVSSPRSESQARIGSRIDPQALLDDLRTHPGVDTALKLPAGPNSGLSVKLP